MMEKRDWIQDVEEETLQRAVFVLEQVDFCETDLRDLIDEFQPNLDTLCELGFYRDLKPVVQSLGVAMRLFEEGRF